MLQLQLQLVLPGCVFTGFPPSSTLPSLAAELGPPRRGLQMKDDTVAGVRVSKEAVLADWAWQGRPARRGPRGQGRAQAGSPAGNGRRPRGQARACAACSRKRLRERVAHRHCGSIRRSETPSVLLLLGSQHSAPTEVNVTCAAYWTACAAAAAHGSTSLPSKLALLRTLVKCNRSAQQVL